MTTYITWNPADANSYVSLTSGNLAIGTNLSGFTAYCRGQNPQTTGKYYFEFAFNINSNNYDGVGFSPLGDAITSTTHASAWSIKQGYFFGSSTTSGLPTGSSGTGCVAVDIGAQLAWVRIGSANWNNSGTANPATGAGGFAFKTGGTGAWAPWVQCSDNPANTEFTANFGASSFSYTVPSGFSAWPGLAAVASGNNMLFGS